MKFLLTTLLGALSLGTLCSAQLPDMNPGSETVDTSPRARRALGLDPFGADEGFCGEPVAVRLPYGSSATGTGGTPLERLGGGQLQMVLQRDASLLSSNFENYVINSSNNKLSLRINGTLLPTITLDSGIRTAEGIADDLEDVPAFKAVADARGWKADRTIEAVLIRSRGATFGTIQVLNTTNSAHATLGFSIGTTVTQVTSARQTVIEQAMADWEALILDGGNIMSPYTLRVAYRPTAPGGALASAGPIYSGSVIVGGIVNVDGTDAWFEDPTPAEDSEFTSGCVPDGCATCPRSCHDLLSVMRHEIGHALGWIGSDGLADWNTTLLAPMTDTDTTATVVSTFGFLDSGSFTVNGEKIEYASKTATQFLNLTREEPVAHAAFSLLNSDNRWDSNRLDIGVFSRGTHSHGTEHPGSIMQPSIGTNVRRNIELYPTAVRLSRSQDARIPMVVLDPDGSPTPDGRANYPYPDLSGAASASAPGIPLLLTSGTYLDPAIPFAVIEAHELLATRNALAIVR